MDEHQQDELVLRLVLEHVYSKGDWPRLQELHHRIFRELRADFDVRDVAARLVPASINRGWGLQEQLILPLSTFRGIPEALPLQRALVEFIRLAVAKYRSSQGDVEVTQLEAARSLEVGSREVDLLPLVISREPFVSNGSRQDESGWAIGISDEIVRLRQVSDLESYFAFKDELRQSADRDLRRLAQARFATTATMERSLDPPISTAEDAGLEPKPTFWARHRVGILRFAVAVAAGVVATILTWPISDLFGPDDPSPRAEGCSPFTVYAQNRWPPQGAIVRADPDHHSGEIRRLQGNATLLVDGWVLGSTPYPSDPPPYDSNLWFRLADEPGWIAFSAIRSEPTSYAPQSPDGGPPVPAEAGCGL